VGACRYAKESIHSGEDMKVSDRALNRLKAATEGLPFPEEIKRIRVKLGLTQEAAGKLIGGGPRRFRNMKPATSCAAAPSAACWHCLTATRRDFSVLHARPRVAAPEDSSGRRRAGD
jgi:HTH-type transcriptional regulator/antitoxin MqsA